MDYIPYGMYYGCSGIKEIVIPENIKEIGRYAYYGLSEISELEIPEQVEKIEDSAFGGMSSLKKIKLPIDYQYLYAAGIPFRDCPVQEICYSRGKTGVMPDVSTSWGDPNCYVRRLEYKVSDSLRKVTFEEGVTRIGAYAYYGWKENNSNLTEVRLPDSLTSIGDHAFSRQESLENIEIPENVTEIGAAAFAQCSANLILWSEKNSVTETYATINNIAFKAINYPYLKYDNIEELTPGQDYQFAATVYTGINESTDKVTWNVAGAVSNDTIIDLSGLLSVAANERAKELTVLAAYGEEISSAKFAVKVNEHEHTYEYQITKAATCTEVGTGTYTCSICDDSYIEDIPALGHDYGNWIITKEATYTEEGIEEQICSRDSSHTQTRSIPKLKVPLSACEIQLSDAAYVYDGTEKKPAVTVIYNGVVLTEGVDYILLYTNNINPGTAMITAEAMENSSYTGSIQASFEIRPAMDENTVTVQPNAFKGCSNLMNLKIRATVTEIGDQAFADCKNLRSVYFYGNCPKIGKDIFKNVKATVYYPYKDITWTLDKFQNYGGTITWCPWNPQTGKPEKRDLTNGRIMVNVKNLIYNGKAQTPQVTVKDGSRTLQPGRDYTVSYKNNVKAGTAVATVTGKGSYGGSISARFTIGKANNVIKVSDINRNFSAKKQTVSSGVRVYGGAKLVYASNNKSVRVDKSGKITIAGNYVGKAVITVKASETSCYKAVSKKFNVTVKPATTAISRAVNSARNTITVSWKTNKTCSGYAVQYSTDKNFKRGVKTVYIGRNSTSRVNLTRLSKGKTYYIRIASYKKIGNAKIYSSWSKVKYMKVRK